MKRSSRLGRTSWMRWMGVPAARSWSMRGWRVAGLVMPTRIVGPSISIHCPVGRWPRSSVRRRGGGPPVNVAVVAAGRVTGWTVAARVSRIGRGSWPLEATSIS